VTASGDRFHDDSPGVELAVVQFTKALHTQFVDSHSHVHDAFVVSHEREHELASTAHAKALEASHKRLADEFHNFTTFYNSVLGDLNTRLDERHAASEVALSAALEAKDKATANAFAASEKAILKAEVSIEKRADATYVALAELQRMLADLMPRIEAEGRISQLAEKVGELDKRNQGSFASMGTRLDEAQGAKKGAQEQRQTISAAAALIGTLVGIMVGVVALIGVIVART